MEKKNLLIFEGDSDYASILKKAFVEYGFNVLIAKTESNFQEHLGLDTIDLFIIRAENPYVNGFLLCKKIRDMKEYKTTPILLLSSDADEAVFEKHRKFAFAADEYLRLPKETEEILVAAHSLLPFIEEDGEMEEPGIPIAIPEDDEDESIELTVEPTVVAPAPMNIQEDAESNRESANDEIEQAFLAVTQENEELQKEISILKQKLKDSENKPQKPDNSKEIEDTKEEIQLLRNKNAELATERERFITELGELKNGLAQKSLQIENLHKTMEEMEEIAESVGNGASSEELDNIKTAYENQKNEYEKLRKELEQQKQICGKLEIEKSDLVEDSDMHKKEIAALKEQIHELQTKPETPKSDLEKELIDLRDENEDLKLINKNMKIRVREIETEIEKVKEETAIEIGKVKEERREFEEEKHELKELISQIENEKAELLNEKDSLEHLAAELKVAHEDVTLSLEEKNQTITELEEKCSESRTTIVELKEKLADFIDLKEDFNKLKAEKESADKNIADKAAEIERLNTLLNSREAELRKHGEMLSSVAVEKDNLLKELDSKKHTIEAITSQKEEVEKHYREAHAKSEKLTQTLQSLKNVVESVKKTVNSVEL